MTKGEFLRRRGLRAYATILAVAVGWSGAVLVYQGAMPAWLAGVSVILAGSICLYAEQVG